MIVIVYVVVVVRDVEYHGGWEIETSGEASESARGGSGEAGTVNVNVEADGAELFEDLEETGEVLTMGFAV